MLFKISFYFLIFLFFCGNNTLLIRAAKSQSNNKLQTISIDYLKKNLPNFDYILGPGDKIQIIVSPEYPELNQVEIIDGEGTINLIKLGKVYVKDLSVKELNALLKEAYEKYVKYPSVIIEIVNYRPIKVWVEGEVASPGLVNLRGSLSNEKPNIEVDTFSNALGIKTENYDLLSNDRTNYYFPTLSDAIGQIGG